MPKLSPNQESSLVALRRATTDRGVQYASKSAWKQHCDEGVSVNAAAMLKTGAITSVKVVVSTNDKVTELYAPTAASE